MDFHAKWCEPCKTFSKIIDKLLESGIPVHKVDVDEDPQLASNFQVMAVPTMVLFEDGQPIGSYTGVKSFDYLKKIFEE